MNRAAVANRPGVGQWLVWGVLLLTLLAGCGPQNGANAVSNSSSRSQVTGVVPGQVMAVAASNCGNLSVDVIIDNDTSQPLPLTGLSCDGSGNFSGTLSSPRAIGSHSFSLEYFINDPSYNTPVEVATYAGVQATVVAGGSASLTLAPPDTSIDTSGDNITNINELNLGLNPFVKNTFTLSVSVTGSAGSGLAVDNGADTLSIGSDGTFTFQTPLLYTNAYKVTVTTQPADSTCEVVDGSGTMGTSNQTVNVSCHTLFPIADTPDTPGAYCDTSNTSALGRETTKSAAFDGTNYMVGVQGDANSCRSITAQLVSPSGTLIGSRITIPGNTEGPGNAPAAFAQGGAPGVTFDGTNYLLVWTQDSSTPLALYGQFISPSGQLVGTIFAIASTQSSTPIEDGFPIFDGANYFVEWEELIASGSPSYPMNSYAVYGQFITPTGNLLGSPILLTPSNTAYIPALAFDGTNILVVWADGRNSIPSGTSSTCYTDSTGTHCYESNIYGQFVSQSTSSLPGTPVGSNFQIQAASLPEDQFIDIAFDGTDYLVTYSQETTLPNACASSGCTWNVYGQLVSTAGSPVGSTIALADTTIDHGAPLPTFNGTQYLVTWVDIDQGTTPPISVLKGRHFTTSGNPSDSSFTIFSPLSDGRVPFFGYIVPGESGTTWLSVADYASAGIDLSNTDPAVNADVYGVRIEK